MAGGCSSLSAASFPDPREVKIEVGESSSRKPPRPSPRPAPRPRVRPPPPASRVNLTLDKAVEYELKHGNLDPKLGTKKIRRIVSNRLAAQRSRLRRSRRVMDLEAKTKSLEELIKNLTPQLEALQKSTQLLQEEHDSLQAAFEFYENQFLISQRATDELRAEIIRLKEEERMNQEMQQLQLDVVYEAEAEDELEEDEIEVDQYLNLEEITRNVDSFPGI